MKDKKADVIEVETGARRPRDNEFIFDHRELDLTSPFLDMCKYIQKNSDLKIEEIPKNEMHVGDAYGFRVSKK